MLKDPHPLHVTRARLLFPLTRVSFAPCSSGPVTPSPDDLLYKTTSPLLLIASPSDELNLPAVLGYHRP